MRSDRRWPVAIVGAGFAGTLTAAQLARKGIASVLIEGGGRAGQGAAYSTGDPAHLLNVPAANMSAWPDVPDDFARRTGDPALFAQRRDYGAYVRAILDEAVANGGVTLVRGSATAAEPGERGWTVGIADGEPIAADALVLATGNAPPGRFAPLEPAGARLVANPWSSAAREAIAQAAASGGAVLIVGTGLTMVDVVLSLNAAGHQGEIVALSRRGLIPPGHSAYAPAPLDAAPQGSVTQLLRWLRRRSAEVGWRAAVDSLRPHSAALWQSLRQDGQRRFLRHARPWWDVHRHRIAPEVAQLLVELVGSGRLQVIAGRVERCSADGEVAFRRRGSGEVITRRFAHLLNCTGPLGSIAQSPDPLLRGLIASGAARADALGLGLAVDQSSRVEGSARAWAVGPPTKGVFWEIVAVPDIRVQAAAVAADIARELAVR